MNDLNLIAEYVAYAMIEGDETFQEAMIWALRYLEVGNITEAEYETIRAKASKHFRDWKKREEYRGPFLF